MGVEVVTAATGLLITLDEAKQSLRVDDDVRDQNALIYRCMQAAHTAVANYTETTLGATTLRLKLDKFPGSADHNEIKLPYGPWTAINSIKYLSAEAPYSELTVSASDYELDVSVQPERVYPINDTQSWPSPVRNIQNAIRVEGTAGFTTTTLPSDLRQAFLMIVGHLYENPQVLITGTITTKVPMGARFLMDNYRQWEFDQSEN